MKRIALFGSRGQLGVELKSEFTARGYEVACFDRSLVDITDAAAVEAYHQAFTKLSVSTTMGDETHELLYAHRDRLSHR